jgi:hypothetical protein
MRWRRTGPNRPASLRFRGNGGLRDRRAGRPLIASRCAATNTVLEGVVRSIDELLTSEDAWNDVLRPLLANAKQDCRVVATSEERGHATLLALQVTRRSTLGALALGCAGIVLDHGWLRVFGAGDAASGFDGLADWNPAGDPQAMAAQGYCLIGADAVGGFFAIDGGRFGAPGRVFYLDPRHVSWVPLNLGHTEFVSWAIGGDVERFYEDLRWPGWEREVESLTLAQGMSFYPPPWTKEGRELAETSRRPAPLRELWSLAKSIHEQLGGAGY